MAFDKFKVLPIGDAVSQYLSEMHNQAWLPHMLADLLNSVSPAVQMAVIESDYIDKDYSASYFEQRGRSFTPTKRATTRIHFFGSEVTKHNLIDPTADTIEMMKSCYLGFTVVRPDLPTTLGRTFLKCPAQINGHPARFPTRSVSTVNLAGIPLEVEASPYMSQDGKVMACATAALWMSTTPLADKIPEIASHTTTEITSMAMSLNRPFGPVVGKRGLHPLEMEQALLATGFDPSSYWRPTPEELIEICHLFSDSGIPPVLLVDTNGIGHAITVVGYTLKSPGSIMPSQPPLVPAHQYIDNLIVHDDMRGMYLPAKVVPAPTPTPVHQTELEIVMPYGTDILSCQEVLVPLPGRVMLGVAEVKAQAITWIQNAIDQKWIEDRDIVTRTILVQSNTFKQTLLERRDRDNDLDGYPAYFVTLARGLPMPRYIWLVEVSYKDSWDPTDPGSPPVIADLLFDSTSIETIRPHYLLLHFPSISLGRLVTENEIEVVHDTDVGDHPHPPFPDIPRP